MTNHIPGIKRLTVNGREQFFVRITMQGKKHTVGTFYSLDAAVAALFAFKMKMSLPAQAQAGKGSEQESKLAERIVIKQQKEDSIPRDIKKDIIKHAFTEDAMLDMLSYEPPHALFSGQPYTVVLENGELFTIPAQIVDKYIAKLYLL